MVLAKQLGFEQTVKDLRSGLPVEDLRFDVVFPESIRNASETHWTPVPVARRAAELLDKGPGTRVLDVGSGAGKFCLVAALTSSCTYVGVEQRPPLVQLARNLARQFGIERTSFIQAGMEELDWGAFNAFYLYNPFIESLYPASSRIDSFVSFDEQKYVRQVRLTQMKLALLPVGTTVVTFHGFGGDFPPGYEPVVKEPWGEDCLIRWDRLSG